MDSFLDSYSTPTKVEITFQSTENSFKNLAFKSNCGNFLQYLIIGMILSSSLFEISCQIHGPGVNSCIVCIVAN